MAEKILKSPGVSAREIDLSQPGQVAIQGTPAVIIGTAQKGPAFVPVTFANMADFNSRFGPSDGKKFGPIAVAEWMRNARSGAYVRVLGVGKGEKALSTGVVENAGFVVGSRQVQATGLVGHNKYGAAGGPLGRTMFLSAIMAETSTSKYFTDAGISSPMSASIVRGVMMFPSGVLPGLSGSGASNPTTASANAAGTGFPGTMVQAYGAGLNAGARHGSMDLSANGGSTFTMYLNGYSGTYPSVITASMDPGSSNYFANVLNTDPASIEKKGHLLYSHFDIDSALATVAPNNGMPGHRTRVLISSGSGTRNSQDGSNYRPNYEGFETRFLHAKSPYFISQTIGNAEKNLFRFHSLDAGTYGNDKVKISIANVQKSRDVNNKYGSFDVLVRKFDDYDSNPIIVEKFIGCDLNPNSSRFISRVVGDTNVFYDFEKATANQKLVVEGSYSNQSAYIRVEVVDTVEAGTMNEEALPIGFRGFFHLVTSGTHMVLPHEASATALPAEGGSPKEAMFLEMQQPPVLYRKSVASGTGNTSRVVSDLYWGVQNTVVTDIDTPNGSTQINSTAKNYTKYHPAYEGAYPSWAGNNEGLANQAASIVDADLFMKHKFSLEKVRVKTKSNADEVDPSQWANAEYLRSGNANDAASGKANSDGYRFLSVDKDLGQQASRRYYKFTTFMQGGFDGVNVFDSKRRDLLNAAAVREIIDSTNQGGVAGNTVASYRKAIDVIAEKSSIDLQVLAIPGLREPAVTDYAIDRTEERFDALYVMDIEECDYTGASDGSLITGSVQQVSVTNTAARLQARSLDTSFAAAYFPDLLIRDNITGANVRCPPSVGVLGALSLNDAVAHPWFAPAGFNRGALATTEEAQVKMNRANLDTLYEVDINPITSFPSSKGVVVFGQKTLQVAQSALDRVNVRRLLIDIRRKVRRVAQGIIFEPNREATLARFSGAVQPILTRIQAQQGLDRFKVIIDSTTTTQLDVENNTVRGKIFLQPTKSVEFISLDFVVTNAGAEI
jgi:hypothetical protein